MIKKLKRLLKENRGYHKKQISLLQELEWANVYHDSIRGIDWLENLPLNIGRWAGNYAFFYVLHRILQDCKPDRILEMGLGESTKFISKYLENSLTNSTHLVIEHDKQWSNKFTANFELSERTKICICPLEEKTTLGFSYNSYSNFENAINTKAFDLYVVDGPIGSSRFSRYDILEAIKHVDKSKEFIVLFDDMNRYGEKDTYRAVLDFLSNKSIEVFQGRYQGVKEVKIIATQKFKFLNTI